MSSLTCPYCERENDTHAPTGQDNEGPADGDVSICWKCHNIGIFEENGTSVRRTSPEEDVKLRQDEHILNALMVVKKAPGPTAAADLLRHHDAWQASHLRTETGPDNA